MTTMNKLIRKPFDLCDYPKYQSEKREALLFPDQECEAVLEALFQSVMNAMSERTELPILRVADGEFQFLLGKNEWNLRKPKIELFRNIIGSWYRAIIGTTFEAKSRTYSSGRYTKDEHDLVAKTYRECLHYIASKGILAIYTITKPNFYTEQYLEKFFRFLDASDAKITNNNYVPFYFVYILLTNPKYNDIYKGKNIHLVSGFDFKKKENIEKSLHALGATSVTWTQISQNRSLFDTIDPSSIPPKADIVFVGGGVGKTNIFNQLRGINCPIVDAGYIFEIWNDGGLAQERDYCSVLK